MRKYQLLFQVFAVFVIFSSFRAADLVITTPEPGAVIYPDERLILRAGGLDTDSTEYVWTVGGSELAPGGSDAMYDGGIAVGVQTIKVEAFRGGSLLAEASAELEVISRPVQFSLSESIDWEGEFSRRGTMVAFTSFRSGDPEIWTASASGQAVERLTYSEGWNPAWSSDGKYLAFWSDRSGKRNVYRVDLDEDKKTAEPLAPDYVSAWSPAYSPSDSRLVYTSFDKHGRRIMVVDTEMEGSEAQEVVPYRLHPMFPRWLPGADGLVFTSFAGTKSSVQRVTFGVDGSQSFAELAVDGAQDADVSPDGNLLTFVRNGDVFLKKISGGLERLLTRDGKGCLSPRFSADGSRVIFASPQSGNYDLWLVDVPLDML